LCPDVHPSPASRPVSPVRNQHFCSPSSVPHTHHSHSGREKHTFAQESISLATNLSELMQSSRKQPIVAPYPCKFVNSAWPAFRITEFCSWHAGQFCAVTPPMYANETAKRPLVCISASFWRCYPASVHWFALSVSSRQRSHWQRICRSSCNHRESNQLLLRILVSS